MRTVRLTAGQALIRYLINQHVERDGEVTPFFAGIWGIFGHGNIGGLAQAIQQHEREFPYYLARNEQSMVHSAIAFARMKRRLQAQVCLSSIGPGATNMVTGAATATINRIPVLLVAGDTFSERVQSPVLQQLEFEHSPDVTVNDVFRPVTRYWDRIVRPEQLITSLPEAMRVLTSPADTGAAFLAMPQDTATFAYDYPEDMFTQRVWSVARNRADETAVGRAADAIRRAERPVIIAGGGVRYSNAEATLADFSRRHGIPVAETQAGKGSLNFDHPYALGGAGVAGSRGSNMMAENADLVIGIGTRFTDFATASKSAFQNPDVRFVNINVFEMDAHKHAGIAVTGDAKVSLVELDGLLGDHCTDADYQQEVGDHVQWWTDEVDRVYAERTPSLPTQGSLIGAVVESADPRDVVINSAGSLPGDLLKLWRSRDPLSYQVEYGYSVMGYEIPAGLGAKMADPTREVYVMVGDATFLMANSEIATAVQENLKIINIVIDNHGFSSVGRVSEQVGCEGYGCHYRSRGEDDTYSGPVHEHDLAQICRGLGATVFEAGSLEEFRQALQDARASDRTCCIVIETDWHVRVPGYATCWWDMATAEVSEMPAVQVAREDYEKQKQSQRWLMTLPQA